MARRSQIEVDERDQLAAAEDRVVRTGVVMADPGPVETTKDPLYGVPMASVRQIQVTFDCAEPERSNSQDLWMRNLDQAAAASVVSSSAVGRSTS
ncbi:hypothetical protein, partial [Micromonospora sp. NPDC023814]|uniref:hypothetical protein n=1 Tax=Micromonospora sp. NPDC023814 TaxID=3154596 RepID=UPI0033C1AB8A